MGNYDVLCGGFAEEAFFALTNKPSLNLDQKHKDGKLTLAEVKSYIENRHLVTIYKRVGPDTSSAHAYTVIAVNEKDSEVNLFDPRDKRIDVKWKEIMPSEEKKSLWYCPTVAFYDEYKSNVQMCAIKHNMKIKNAQAAGVEDEQGIIVHMREKDLRKERGKPIIKQLKGKKHYDIYIGKRDYRKYAVVYYKQGAVVTVHQALSLFQQDRELGLKKQKEKCEKVRNERLRNEQRLQEEEQRRQEEE